MMFAASSSFPARKYGMAPYTAPLPSRVSMLDTSGCDGGDGSLTATAKTPSATRVGMA